MISRLGFTLADPAFVEHNPEPYGGDAETDVDDMDLEAKAVDWDAHDLRRNVPVIAQRSAEPVLA